MSIEALTDRKATLSPAKQALLERLKRGGLSVAPAAGAIRPRAGDGPAPLSPAQQRLWFLQRMEPETTAFNLAQTLRLRGPVDAGALDRAFTEIVRRHHVLRTVFRLHDGEPVQVVTPAPASVLRVEAAAEAFGHPASGRLVGLAPGIAVASIWVPTLLIIWYRRWRTATVGTTSA